MEPYAAVILAGGAARRLGGVDKPMLMVRGRPMLHRVLDAVPDATDRIVVGPPSLRLPPGVRRVREEPPGGGPVAATAAGVASLAGGAGAGAGGTGVVALLAADLPFLDPAAILTLRTALAASTVDGVVFVDGDGRRQTLCGVWRTAPLRAALNGIGPPAGVPLRRLLAGLRVGEAVVPAGGALLPAGGAVLPADGAVVPTGETRRSGDRGVPAGAGAPPPWYDCDEPDDLHRAEEWPDVRT